jgi:hypothetical protein
VDGLDSVHTKPLLDVLKGGSNPHTRTSKHPGAKASTPRR